MLGLSYHYNVLSTEDVIFQFPYSNLYPHCHFGDQIAILNMHLYFNKLYNLKGKLSVLNINNLEETYLANLFFKESDITNKNPTYLINLPENDRSHDIFGNHELVFTEIYKNWYQKVSCNKIKDDINDKIVTYSFDANSFSEHKIPPYTKYLIDDLRSMYNDVQFIEVGKKITIKNTIDYINRSILFIGIDNGVSHLCRCLNTSHVILEHIIDVNRGFPKEYYNYIKFKTYNDIINFKFI